MSARDHVVVWISLRHVGASVPWCFHRDAECNAGRPRSKPLVPTVESAVRANGLVPCMRCGADPDASPHPSLRSLRDEYDRGRAAVLLRTANRLVLQRRDGDVWEIALAGEDQGGEHRWISADQWPPEQAGALLAALREDDERLGRLLLETTASLSRPSRAS